jgi:hypothetical protein
MNANLAAERVGVKLAPEQVERRRLTALQLGLRHPNIRPGGNELWTAEELALLGTIPDGEVAAQVGRPANAVRLQRCKRGIPNPLDRRRRENRTSPDTVSSL